MEERKEGGKEISNGTILYVMMTAATMVVMKMMVVV